MKTRDSWFTSDDCPEILDEEHEQRLPVQTETPPQFWLEGFRVLGVVYELGGMTWKIEGLVPRLDCVPGQVVDVPDLGLGVVTLVSQDFQSLETMVKVVWQ